MTRFVKKILKYAVTIALIVIYMNIVAFLVPYFDLEYTVFEFILIALALVFAIITSEFIFRGK
ncbi:hypothetical protein [Bacillus sp. BHET2]|uniref:hypothetical protein n=1 Tax=Bacillus sp. BHET2 TaxID=2583818 RepID=UPI00110F4017|nr:hypothetical protein [Bacillus sp. BHET2]